jgi:hypothetical protein
MKKIISLLTVLCICLGLFAGLTAQANGTGIVYWDGTKPATIAASGMQGSGTENDPYLITNGAQLYAMVKTSGNGGSHFKLTNDIYLNENYENYASWNASTKPANVWDLGSTGSNNNSFSAITTSFNGVLDGDGYTVYGFYSNQDFYGALIPLANHIADDYDNPVIIKNLNMAYCTSIGGRNGGFILGGVLYRDNDSVTIENCTVKNGYFYNPWTTNNTAIGGIVGDVGKPTVIKNCAVSDITFKYNATDLAQYSRYASIAGGVNANLSANGAFSTGQVSALKIEDCYAVNVKTMSNILLWPVGIFYSGSGYSNCVTVIDTYTDSTTQPKINNVGLIYSADGQTQLSTNPIITITANGIKGDAAKTAMLGLDWVGKKWVTVANGYPVPHAKHNIIIVPAESASCGKEGLTESKVCSECGEVILAPEKTSALVHDFSGEWTDAGEGGFIRSCANNCGENEYYATVSADGIKAESSVDAIPEGSTLYVEELKSGTTYSALDKTLGDTARKFKAWDVIALDSQGGAIPPDGTVAITFDIPSGFSDNIKVYYFDGADSVEEVAIKNQTATTVTVLAQHLSIYAIVDVAQTNTGSVVKPEGDGDTEKENLNKTDLGIILNGGTTTTSPKTGESIAFLALTIILLGGAAFIFVKKFCK